MWNAIRDLIPGLLGPKEPKLPPWVSIEVNSMGHFIELLQMDETLTSIEAFQYFTDYGGAPHWGPYGFGGSFRAYSESRRWCYAVNVIFESGILRNIVHMQPIHTDGDYIRMAENASSGLNRYLRKLEKLFPQAKVTMKRMDGTEISEEERQERWPETDQSSE